MLKDTAGIEFAPAARKTIDLEGRVVKDAVRKALKVRQNALTILVHAIREYRKLVDEPLTLRGSEYAHAVQQLNKAILANNASPLVILAVLHEELTKRGDRVYTQVS